MSLSATITIPMLPPSVNHYKQPRGFGRGFYKTKMAHAWEQAFAVFVCDAHVQGKRFSVSVDLFLGPKDKLDIDNCLKCVLDCVAHNGMMRDKRGKPLSDSHVKALRVMKWDSQQIRKDGPRTIIRVEAL